jgi:hypothetical protein
MPYWSGGVGGNSVSGPNWVYINWQLASQSQAGNYSVVNWQVGWHFQGTVTCRGLRSGDGAINGSVVYNAYGSGDNIHTFVSGHSHSDLQTGSGSFVIYHDANGYANISVTAGMTGYNGERSNAASGVWDLPRIPKVSGAPGTPAGTPSGNSIALSWAAPGDDGGSGITSYTVQRADDSGFTTNVVTYAGIGGTSTTLTGLAYGKTYYTRVSATNGIGTSAYSSSTSDTTDITVPGAPTGVAVSGITPVQADVSWSAPAFDGGSALTGYDVQSAKDSAFTVGVVTVADSASPNTLTGLLPGTNYWVRVRAKNAAGAGAWSTAATFKTLPGVYIGTGTGWSNALVYVGNGTSWVLAQVKSGNGSTWK